MVLLTDETRDARDDSEAIDLVTDSGKLCVSVEIKELDELLIDETKVMDDETKRGAVLVRTIDCSEEVLDLASEAKDDCGTILELVALLSFELAERIDDKEFDPVPMEDGKV